MSLMGGDSIKPAARMMKEWPKGKTKFAWVVHRWLMPSAGVLFVIVGLAKLVSVFGEAELLGKLDPVSGISWRVLMTVAGLGEVEVGAVCLLGKSRLFRAESLLFLAGGLLLYRGLYERSGAKEPCKCLGGLLELIGLERGEGDWIATSILFFSLFVGVSGLLMMMGRRQAWESV